MITQHQPGRQLLGPRPSHRLATLAGRQWWGEGGTNLVVCYTIQGVRTQWCGGMWHYSHFMWTWGLLHPQDRVRTDLLLLM